MNDKITGVVQYFNVRDGKFGKSYNVKIDGETYFLNDKTPPRGVDKGALVELEWEYKGNYKTVPRGGIRVVDSGKTTASPPTASKQIPSTAGNSYDARQDVISKQAAMNTALSFLELAAAQGAIPVPKSKNEGYGYLRTLWLKEAATVYQINTGNVWDISHIETDVEEKAPKPVKKQKAKPVEEQDEDVYPEDDDDIDTWDDAVPF